MKAIIHFFKTINDFLNACVDYADTRIRTGKFVGDIIYQNNQFQHFIATTTRKNITTISRSKFTLQLLKITTPLWRMLLKIQLFEITVSILGDMIKLLAIYYSEIFITFALTFPTTILLLNWFQNAIVFFFITLIPILILDIFCVSALYYYIDRQSAKDTLSLWQSYVTILRHFNSFSFPALVESAIALEVLIVFFIIAFFTKYLFDILQIPWSSSVYYWFIVNFIGSLLITGMFLLNIIMHQTYFSVLLDHMPFQQALRYAIGRIKTFLPHHLFFYILLYVFCILFTWRALLSYLYLGLTIGFFGILAFGPFLGFLLRRKLPYKLPSSETNLIINKKTHVVFLIVIAFGFINYVLAAVLLTKEYQPILSFVQQQQDSFLASQDVKRYENPTYQYSLEYPKTWSVYQWRSNSVTFYNNYTGTITGGTWMTVTVSPFDNTTFQQLYNAAPGVIAYDTQTKAITTKVTNIVIQGHEVVNYTFIKPIVPYAQYETHYLIHKNAYLYDMAFTSVTNDVENYNSDLFQKIINSFRFTQQ